MDSEIIITHIPSLVATLQNQEQANGAPLTREDVEAIRDGAPCVALTRYQRTAVDDGRGYGDIDSERAWDDWQVDRLDLATVGS